MGFLGCNDIEVTPPIAEVITGKENFTTEELLNKVQEANFGYFWDFADANSGLALEGSSTSGIVTTGGSGFGIACFSAAVERDWYTQGKDAITLHWSQNYNFQIDLTVSGWNEGLILYVLAASSPRHGIQKMCL